MLSNIKGIVKPLNSNLSLVHSATIIATVKRHALAAAALVSIIVSLSVHGHTIFQNKAFTDDIAMHHVWLDDGVNSGFSDHDPWLQTSKDFQPYLLALLWKLLSVFLPTAQMGKCLAVTLLALTGFLIFLCGKMLKGERVGWVAMALLFASDAWIGITGGFARSFAFPLVCGFIASSLAGRRSWVALILFLSAALYPVVFVMLVPTHSIIWLFSELKGGISSWRQDKKNYFLSQCRDQRVVIAAVLCGGSLMLMKSLELTTHPLIGPLVQASAISEDPIFSANGRVPLWPQPSLLPVLEWSLLPWDKTLLEPLVRRFQSTFVGYGYMTAMLRMIVLLAPCVVITAVIYSSARRGLIILALVLGAILSFFCAKIFMPQLYEPARYLVWSIPIIAVLTWAIIFDHVLDCFVPECLQQFILIVSLSAIIMRFPSISGKGAEDTSEYSALYSELLHTPAGEVIACFPRTGDFIPLLSHRSVFISHEFSHAVLFSRYRAMVMERHAALIKAFYSSNADDVREFCARQRLDWLVIEEKYYRGDIAHGFHFSPFEKIIRELIQQNPEPWVLLRARSEGKLVQPGVYLLSAKSIKG